LTSGGIAVRDRREALGNVALFYAGARPVSIPTTGISTVTTTAQREFIIMEKYGIIFLR